MGVLLLIAIGLSFDTFAVSVSTGLLVNHIKFWQAVRVAFILALFQSLMPFVGWVTGNQVKDYIENYDHWIAFILLLILGLKMIKESMDKEEEKSSTDPLKLIVLMWMAIATSIDALVVGFTFTLIGTNIGISCFVIGSITFIVAMLGMLFGKNIGSRYGKKLEIIGGLILISIGTKILIEHTL